MALSTQAPQYDSCGSEITSAMASLVSLVECLPHAETNPGKHEKMQGHGKCALKKMMDMKQALEAQESALGSEIGDLHVKKRELKDEEKEKTRNLSQLEIQMEYQEKICPLLQKKLAYAENHLEELLALLKKARKEEKCSKVLTSIILVLLPLCTLMCLYVPCSESHPGVAKNHQPVQSPGLRLPTGSEHVLQRDERNQEED
ncbi:uncharacterized protein [Emydura macquarii macquarii]|uniref:uncharacterized protein n=1 Tax=Emydura macquarii macquarii TaxID=1129001 RepID=UPI00352BA4C8